MDFSALVEELAVAHRAKAAFNVLKQAGPVAVDALIEGLEHADPRVRAGCCDVLDFSLNEAAIPALLANVEHPHPWVRARALHALACDKCKQGVCRPGEDEVVALAIDKLESDPDRYVRKSAVEALGPAVHRRADIAAALERASAGDADPLVRKVASWWAPGGPRFRATAR